MRWLYTAIILSSTLLMRAEAMSQTVDVSNYEVKPDSEIGRAHV